MPIDILFPARGEKDDRVKAVTVIVDENPVPLVTVLARTNRPAHSIFRRESG